MSLVSESRQLLFSGERIRAFAAAKGDVHTVVLVGDEEALDDVERAHGAITSPHVPRVVARPSRDELVCDCDAVLGLGDALETLSSRGERVAYGVGIALNEIAMNTVEAAHEAGEHLGALCWNNVWFGPAGHAWWFGFGHNFPAVGPGARSCPGWVEAPEVSFGKAPDAASDVFVLHAWIRTMLPMVEAPPLFADILASDGQDDAGLALRELTTDLSSIDASQRPQTVAGLRERYRAIRARFPGMPEPDFDGVVSIVGPLARDVVAAQLGATLRITDDGRQLQIDDGEVVDLARRTTLRRVMALLIERHQQASSAPASLADVLAAGWPDERVTEESGRARVYVAISTLRKLGLDPLIERTEEGYRLVPTTPPPPRLIPPARDLAGVQRHMPARSVQNISRHCGGMCSALPRDMTTRCFIAFAVGALLTGCSPADEPGPPSVGPGPDTCVDMAEMPEGPTLVPGELDFDGSFSEIADGQIVERFYGPQGGTHVELAARVFNAASEDHIVLIDVADGDSSRVGVVGCDGWGEAAFRVFDPNPQLDLTLTLLDLDREEQAVVVLHLDVDG